MAKRKKKRSARRIERAALKAKAIKKAARQAEKAKTKSTLAKNGSAKKSLAKKIPSRPRKEKVAAPRNVKAPPRMLAKAVRASTTQVSPAADQKIAA